MDPDALLAEMVDWRDISTWPVSSRETMRVKRETKRQADPLAKPGIVGAFCRTYSIEDAIDRFLADVYEEAHIPGRYTYKAGEGTAGVVVYEGKFAYSHHATDPASGMLLNAFDLVRIHRFPGDDAKASLKAMSDFALMQPEVKKTLSMERQAEAEMDFSGEDWQTGLKYNRQGVLENSTHNLGLILRNDPSYSGFAYNDMSGMVQIIGAVPWKRPRTHRFWMESDTCAMKERIDNAYATFSNRNYEIAFTNVAMERSFHAVRNYLDHLPEWDGIERIPTLLVRCMQADDTRYTRTVTRKTFAAAVARVYEPGIKFDSVVVLNGPQGMGKSSFFAKLGGKWFSDSLTISDMKDKAAPEKLQGYWILELGELAGLKKMDVETVKAFITRQDDKFRHSYGYSVEDHPRQCIIVGSTNNGDPLK